MKEFNKWFSNQKLVKKMAVGFGIVALILALCVSVSLLGVSRVNKANNRIFNLRAPTAETSAIMLQGLQRSLADLRGWMLLGVAEFEEERVEVAWNKEILPSLEKMKELSKQWTNPENVTRLDRIAANIGDFQKYQQEIADMVHKPENRPALMLLVQEATPRANIITDQITAMIDAEKTLPATADRKELLGLMADFRGSLGQCLGDMRAFLLSGDEAFRVHFEKFWATNGDWFGALQARAGLFNQAQTQAFQKLTAARGEFSELPPRMFEIRGGEEWDKASFWLKTRAAPLAKLIISDLDAMVADQKNLRNLDILHEKKLSSNLVWVMWTLLFIGLILCAGVGWIISRVLSNSVFSLVSLADQVTQGRLDLEIDSDSKDEFGTLHKSFQRMLDTLRSKRDAIDSFAKGVVPPEVPMISSEDGVGLALQELKRSQENKEEVILQISDGVVPAEVPLASNSDSVGLALKKLTASQNQKTQAVSSLADGDLTAKVELSSEADSLGKALIKTFADLRVLLKKIQETSNMVGSAAEELSSTSLSLSEGIESQAGTTTEIAATTNELSAQINQNTANAEEAKKLANTVRDRASTGNEQMNSMVEAMGEIEVAGNSIGKVVEVINKIASQTNLLALNASIEAASAGEAGKGFAVVADEIKKLSRDTTSATDEIVSIIGTLTEKVSSGSSVVDKTNGALCEIVSGIGEAANLITEMAHAARTQADAVDECRRALEELDQVSQANSSAASQSTAASIELATLAESLLLILGKFRVEADQHTTSQPDQVALAVS